MRLLAELRRRKVFRVAAAYAVVAWGLAQVADLVLANTSAPPWVMQVILLVLALGFPIAVILAWAFEVTPDRVKRTEAPGAGAAPKLGGQDAVLIALLLGVIGVAGYQFVTLLATDSVAASSATSDAVETSANDEDPAAEPKRSTNRAPARTTIAAWPPRTVIDYPGKDW